LKTKPQRYQCPHCKWDFALRKKGCCPGCGTLLLIGSDAFSDAEFRALGSFWMWEPLKERWVFIRDWEEHKQEAGRRFEEYFKSSRLGSGDTEEMRRPLREWIH
jgi:hypothetical protein